MNARRFFLIFPALVTIAAGLAVPAAAQTTGECCSPGLTPSGPQAQAPEFVDLAGPGKKNWIGEVAYFTWEFDQKPKMGPVILKVELFDKSGNRIQDLEITGRSDMPSMAGAHDSGEVAFKLNKKGDYLLPVNIVMPGGWEVRLTFARNGVVIFRGRIVFDV